MSTEADTRMSQEEYLAFERRSAERHELVAGRLVAMSGASEAHNDVVANLVGEIRQRLKGRPCKVWPSDLRVRIPSAREYVYPDVVAVCGERVFEDGECDTLVNPTFVVEVLSKSTEAYDRGEKFAKYRTIPSLRELLFVSIERRRVELFTRTESGFWILSEVEGREGILRLESIGCEIPLSEIWDKVELEND